MIRSQVSALVVLAASSLSGSGVLANVVSICTTKDNTLYEDAGGALSNGAGTNFFVGKQMTGLIRRGVLSFDVAGNVPAGATINSAILTLSMSQSPAGAQNVDLHRLSADWGEGTSVGAMGGGAGGPAATGDATWLHAFFSTVFWTAPGGDFVVSASASTSVVGVGIYTWGSAAGMVADVQSWLDAPAGNFGWIVIGNESVNQTVKRFDSKEITTPALRPVLTIDYTPPPIPTVSQWGSAILAIMLLALGTLVYRARPIPV